MAEIDEPPDGVAITETTEGTDTVVVSLTGEVDVATVDDAKAAIDEIVARRAPSVLAFDLSGLRFMDSSGLALLIAIAAQVERIEVRNPSAIVRRVIEISGLAEVLPMTATI
jgi:anti-sigma B factor antagonist